MLNKHRVVYAVLSLAILLGVPANHAVRADTTIVEPKGEYAKIDVRLTKETMEILAKAPAAAAERQKAIEKIKASPDKYAPPVFYALSQALFQEGKKDAAVFWFYTGQLRARFDANRCADGSARQAVAVLNNQYGTPIDQYTSQDIPKLEALVPRVVKWDRKTPHHYDHRWINLHGMGAMLKGLGANNPDSKSDPLSLPKEQWSEISEKTRADYLAGFKEAMVQVKKQK